MTDFWHGINNLQLYFLKVCLLIASRNFDYHLDNNASFEPNKKRTEFAILRNLHTCARTTNESETNEINISCFSQLTVFYSPAG